MGRRKKERTGIGSVRARSESAHYTPLTLTFLAFLPLTLFSREFSLSQKLQNEKQPTSNGSVSVWGSNHTHKGVVHTEEGDVSYWAHCVAFYDFCERENSLEKELRCGKAKKGSGQV